MTDSPNAQHPAETKPRRAAFAAGGGTRAVEAKQSSGRRPATSTDLAWPWALGVIVVPSALLDRRRLWELRLSVAVDAYKQGLFLVDTLTVSAEHAAVDLDDVRTLARRTTVEALLVLDTCAGDHRLELALPDELTIYKVEPQPA